MAASAFSRRPQTRHTRAAAAISKGPDGQRRARALHRPRQGEAAIAVEPGRRWVVIGFMAVIHALALVALLPRFWSWPALASLLVLYWVTACLGVTMGYHRLLSHRSYRVPHWL